MSEIRQTRPSFSNEPQKFGGMTLFVKGGKLYLHQPAGCEAHILSGVGVDEMADYYSRYEENELARFMPLAEANVRMLQAHYDSFKGKTSQELDDIKLAIARQLAARWADNCDDDHDLSEAFCKNAADLGAALRDRFNTGLKTMTIIQTYRPAANFVNAPCLKF